MDILLAGFHFTTETSLAGNNSMGLDEFFLHRRRHLLVESALTVDLGPLNLVNVFTLDRVACA